MEILNKLVAEAWEKAGGDCEAAKKEVWRKVNGNRKLYRQICDPLAQMAISESVECHMRTTRRSFWNDGADGADAAAQGNEPRRAYIEGLRESTTFDIYMYPLATGKPLGDATYDDIEKQEQFHLALIRGNTSPYLWMKAIRPFLDKRNKKNVRAVLSRQKLEEFLDQAKTGGADEKAAA